MHCFPIALSETKPECFAGALLTADTQLLMLKLVLSCLGWSAFRVWHWLCYSSAADFHSSESENLYCLEDESEQKENNLMKNA